MLYESLRGTDRGGVGKPLRKTNKSRTGEKGLTVHTSQSDEERGWGSDKKGRHSAKKVTLGTLTEEKSEVPKKNPCS